MRSVNPIKLAVFFRAIRAKSASAAIWVAAFPLCVAVSALAFGENSNLSSLGSIYLRVATSGTHFGRYPRPIDEDRPV